MAKSLYPTTLFHFTSQLEILISILNSEGFKISFAREFIQGVSSNRDFGIPMVSFCDIRLTQLNQHTDSYGHYGIGLTKTWADRNKLNPVIYMNKKSPVFDYYNNELRELSKERLKVKSTLDNLKRNGGSDKELSSAIISFDKIDKEYRNLVDPLRYMKNYQGTLRRRQAPEVRNYIFADEREWRFVPDIHQSKGKAYIASKDGMRQVNGKERYNEQYKDVRLGFLMSDIRYIIVRNESDVPRMIDFLSEKIGDKNTLLTRILSTELIGNDM
ncbi:TPA: abortive infection system antitoxin AbiGi family protein [Serratia marcescens]